MPVNFHGSTSSGPFFWYTKCVTSEQAQMECEDINRNSNHNLLTDSSKRQRVDGVSGLVQFNGPTYGATSQYSGRSFIPIKSSMHTFHSEEVKAEGHTLYTPLLDDTLLNIRIVEQITFESGLYHIGSSTGAYERNSEGYTIMLWKYSEKLNKIFVSRSILFTSREEYWAVRSRLELM